eukprot:TRINITY_DN4345_c0_g1_i1.p1 TRINITY_DN4345_c0_g1~~TRINITY_DN4345_c0_g1_i1.p1  ORF type:complete len:366 (+),score=42.85 TRINITY_DN4345_c0_g1_i1:93-1190(+)
MGNNDSKAQTVNESIPSISYGISCDKYVGCIVGGCLGDSLGLLVEGLPESDCESFVKTCILAYKTYDNPAIKERCEAKGIPFGQISDDSQMAREMIISFIEYNNSIPPTDEKRLIFSPEHYAKRLSQLFLSSEIFGCGLATAKSMARYNRGVIWRECGEPAGKRGNGSTTRVYPVAFFFEPKAGGSLTPSHLEWAGSQSLITHKDPKCIATCIVFASSIRLLLTCENQVKDGFELAQWLLPQLSKMSEGRDESLSKSLLSLLDWLKLSNKNAAKMISKLGMTFDDGSSGIAGVCESTLIWALFCFLKTRLILCKQFARVFLRVGIPIQQPLLRVAYPVLLTASIEFLRTGRNSFEIETNGTLKNL